MAPRLRWTREVAAVSAPSRIKSDRRNSSSTERWKDVPHGTTDEVRSYVALDLPLVWRQGRPIDGSASSQIPRWKGLSANSEEKHEPVSDIDTEAVDGLKMLDHNRPIREATYAV